MDPFAGWLGLEGDASAILLLGALAVARLAPVLSIVPFLGGRTLPVEARIALAVLLAVVLYPSLAVHLGEVPSAPVAVIALLLKEVLVGTGLGLVAALPFAALDASGRLVDTIRGANLAEVLDPHSGQRTSPLGQLHLLLGVAIFLLVGGHDAFLRTLARSFEVLPPTAFPTASVAGIGAFASGVAALGASALAAAVGIAGPAIVAIVASEVALGILNRAAPHLGVYFVGMPLRAAAGLAASALAIAMLVPVLEGRAGEVAAVLDRVLRLAAPPP